MQKPLNSPKSPSITSTAPAEIRHSKLTNHIRITQLPPGPPATPIPPSQATPDPLTQTSHPPQKAHSPTS